MFYVYVLYSRNYDEFCLGWTSNLRKRFSQHCTGQNKSTRKASDWKLVYYEAYLTDKIARKRERNLKISGNAYYSLKQRIRESIQDDLSEGEALDRSPGKRRP
jgi:putative endonuclease